MTFFSAGLVNIVSGTVISAGLATMLLGCGGGGAAAGTPDPGPALSVDTPVADTQPDPLAVVTPGLGSPSRLPSDVGDFPASREGADFAPDLASRNVSMFSSYGRFAPTWDGGPGMTVDDCAYGLYRLGYDPSSAEVSLDISWGPSFPTAGECYVGLSNWTTDSWDWFIVSSPPSIDISSPATYSNAQQQSYVAVVMVAERNLDLATIGFSTNAGGDLTYTIVDTNQSICYSNSAEIGAPAQGAAFHGQDAQYDGAQPSYTDNGDGTITDNVTGLMWQQSYADGEKMTFDESFGYADSLVLGGHDDWRVPTIKELYSLMDFSGYTMMSAAQSKPYLDDDYFDFAYGDESSGERFIDAQYITSTSYTSTTMGGNDTMFGVNFADGRIKGYPKIDPPTQSGKQFYLRCVRGNTDYGVNDFNDNGDGTITDNATGLTWLQDDSVILDAGPRSDGLMNWEEALAWAEGFEYAGYTDWRLPNVKELQSIVDYTRCPDATSSPAIDPVFNCGLYINGNGLTDYYFYWSGTTHVEGPSGDHGCYVAFGEALGWLEQPPDSGNYQLLDVHGAGAQRSDPKSGDPDDYPYGHGPQGDVIMIFNTVRLVRGTSG